MANKLREYETIVEKDFLIQSPFLYLKKCLDYCIHFLFHSNNYSIFHYVDLRLIFAFCSKYNIDKKIIYEDFYCITKFDLTWANKSTADDLTTLYSKSNYRYDDYLTYLK